MLVAQSCPTVCNPVDCSPPGSSVHGDSPGKNTGVGCHALLQGIFPIQGSNPGLLITGRFFTIWANDKPTFFVEGVPNCLVTIESIEESNWCILVIQIELFTIY